MGFTAKNLTKLQPKTRVFSTDYKSSQALSFENKATLFFYKQQPIQMRIVGEVPHPRLKVTLFKNDGKYSFKIEGGMMEQIFKLRDDDRFQETNDVLKLLDEDFLAEMETVFNAMDKARSETFLRHFPQPDDEVFDVII
jgi:hypothetical protein